MSTSKDSLKFTMTSRALKLLGQNLYARPWSAVSELVANGIDAGATTIYVSMTEDPATNTGTLEVLDNGSGMTEEDLEHYVSIGFDKRAVTSTLKSSRAPMGRKGIGKLAALYLSNEYYIHSKTTQDTSTRYDSAWHMELASTQRRTRSQLSIKSTQAQYHRYSCATRSHNKLQEPLSRFLKLNS